MKVSRKGNRVTLKKEPGDRRATSESDLFYKLRNVLIDSGEDVIKKEMSKDGHMVSDNVFYVRSRKVGKPGAYGIYDSRYQLRDCSKEYNERGAVDLTLADLSK